MQSIYDKPDGVYVVIRNRDNRISSVMGPMSGRKADKVENGAIMNVDVDGGWYVRVTDKLDESEQAFLNNKKEAPRA